MRPLSVAAVLAAVLAAVVMAPGPALAQVAAPSAGYTPPIFGTLSPESIKLAEAGTGPAQNKAAPCPGCPARHPWYAVGEVLGINLLYNVVNLVIKPEEEKIYFRTYPKIWWNNISYGFEWDDNTFQVNQFGHPYQGNNYFNAGRSNGLSFWESAPLAALGSLTWEYMGERHKPSLNDLVMTTMGGIALGEMFHRTAWLVRDTRLTGKSRLTKEILATVIDPITGLNRFISGDASKVTEKPADLVPSTLLASFDAGVLWRGEDNSFTSASGDPFLQFNLGYGTLALGRAKKPFDAFAVDMRLGGGAGISEATVRGRLTGRPLGEIPDNDQHPARYFMVVMGYDYHDNTAFQFGGQSVSALFAGSRALSPDWRLTGTGSGGLLVLGAMDSLYVASEERQYDFGPGLVYAANVTLRRRDVPFARASYSGVWMHTVDGAQADHWAQLLRFDLIVPVRGTLGIGTSAEFVRRKSYYDAADDVLQTFPQLRVYLSWLK
jgi:Domain of unknown function (DUF3943)